VAQFELAHVNVPDFTQSGSQGGNQALGVAGESTEEGPVGQPPMTNDDKLMNN
jgi:hypothetical protein